MQIVNQNMGIDEVGYGVKRIQAISNVELESLTSEPARQTDGVRELRIIAAADQRAAAVSPPTLQPATLHRYGGLAGLVAYLGRVYDWLAGPAMTQQERDEATLVAAQAASKGISYL
jgi:hypothetical protein